MRRKDREVANFEDKMSILDKCEYLHLGLSICDKPYVVPMNFGYSNTDGKVVIYLHGTKEGKKHDIIAKNSNVCFEAVCSYKTIRAEESYMWTAQYQSVIGEGRISESETDKEKLQGLACIMRHYGFEGKLDLPPQALKAVKILKIEVESLTGKQNIK